MNDSPSRTAFNAGCDARLRGEPRTRNPYFENATMWRCWNEGWSDVHRYWGARVYHRWHVTPLPPVQEEACA